MTAAVALIWANCLEMTPKSKPICREVPFEDMAVLALEKLDAGELVQFTATGSSMRPLLHDRQSRVRLSAARDVRRGDMLLYRRGKGGYVLHRVVAVELDGTYTCCGDAQWRLEPGICPEQALAVVTAFTLFGRWVSCTNGLYGLYWRAWLLIRPVRRVVFGGWRRLKRRFGW